MPSRRIALAVGAGLVCCALIGGPRAQQRPEKLVFVFSRGIADPATKWLIRLYTEALGRLGIGFEFLEVPPNRATAMSSAGSVDGELGRTYEFATLYPTLVRVEEPNNAVLFVAYAVKPLPAISGWEALRRSSVTMAFRAGLKEVEDEMRNEAYRDRTSIVKEVLSGLQMLQRGRIDLYIDVRNAVEPLLIPPHPELDPALDIRLFGVMHRTTGHAYLHGRHRDLAPELSAVLRAMKAEGRHARYLIEALITHATERGTPASRAKEEAEAAVKYLLSEQ